MATNRYALAGADRAPASSVNCFFAKHRHMFGAQARNLPKCIAAMVR
jgi:hypothetical protein